MNEWIGNLETSLIFFSSKYQAFILNLNTPVGDYFMILIWAEYFCIIKTMGKVTQKQIWSNDNCITYLLLDNKLPQTL